MGNEKPKNDAAFDELCRENQERLENFVFRLANGDEHIADDIIQETYLYAVENKEKLLAHPNPAAWFYKSAHIFHKRNISKYRKAQANEESLDGIIDDEGNEAREKYILDAYREAFDKDGDETRALAMLSVLSENERALVTLHYDEGYSLKEIAALCEAHYGSVRRRHAEILEKLKGYLDAADQSESGLQ